VTIEVEDTGKGIPADEQDRVFERFYRGSATTESGPSGSGLGLAIVQDICRSHGGRIELSDAEGSGLCVRVVFDGLGRIG